MATSDMEREVRREHVIEPRRLGPRERARELWRYRGLIGFFGNRSVDKITGRTILGRWWLVLRPTLEAGTAALIFAGVLKVTSPDVPYLVMFLAGATCWRLFENSLIWATRSLELNRKLLSKVYIPRLLLPFASLAPAFVEFAFWLAFLAAAIGIYSALDGVLYLNLGFELLGAVAGLVLALLFAMGIGLYTAVLGATARDVRFSLGYILGFWYMLTPVIYPLSQVPASFRWIAELNPMTPIVELFKWGLIDAGQVRPVGLAVAGTLIVILWAGGLWFFSRAENEAVDRL